jgi:hypothetical protein
MTLSISIPGWQEPGLENLSLDPKALAATLRP